MCFLHDSKLILDLDSSAALANLTPKTVNLRRMVGNRNRFRLNLVPVRGTKKNFCGSNTFSSETTFGFALLDPDRV